MTVTIWEYNDFKRDSRGQISDLLTGVLATDELAGELSQSQAVKTSDPSLGPTAVTVTHRTHVVVIEATVKTYYRIAPKNPGDGSLTFVAAAGFPYIPANGQVTLAVYPGCTISFSET